ncbi:MAG: DNA polymerase III subunit delta' [Myxococcales bacterium]|jgi:DNA polymerase-3 subunit delta'|nr:DNA polymerase III subunit delta' [Myxococcales bacterium]
MPFSSILGQARAIASLRSALDRGQLHHAYLFGGPEGVGKELTALTLAQAANCETESGDACGKCSACRRIADRNHPDMTWVLPEAEQITRGWAGRADFSATPSRDIRIAQIRALQERLSFRPLEARTRFIFICGADAMNPQAQNALLKTLEEPPPATVLILIAAAPGQLLPTIRSRCLTLSFAPLPTELIEQKLVAQKKLDPALAHLCAALSFGSLGAAFELDVKALEKRRGRIERLAALDAGGVTDALRFAEELAEAKGEAPSALALFETWYRDVALLASLDADSNFEPGHHLLHADMRSLLDASAERLGPVEPLRRIDLCRGVRARLRFNASPRLQLEQLFLRFTRSEA